MTWTMVLLALTTSALTAVLTVGLGAIVVRRLLRQTLDGELAARVELAAARLRDEVADAAAAATPTIRREVEAGVEAAAERALPRIRQAVEGGVRDAGAELLPALRQQVREGFRDGVAEVVTPETLGRAGEEIARRGASVIETGLELLLGRPRDRQRDPED